MQVPENLKWYVTEKKKPDPFVSVLVHMPNEAPLPQVHEGYMADTVIWYANGYFMESSEITHWADMPDFNPNEVME